MLEGTNQTGQQQMTWWQVKPVRRFRELGIHLPKNHFSSLSNMSHKKDYGRRRKFAFAVGQEIRARVIRWGRVFKVVKALKGGFVRLIVGRDLETFSIFVGGDKVKTVGPKEY